MPNSMLLICCLIVLPATAMILHTPPSSIATHAYTPLRSSSPWLRTVPHNFLIKHQLLRTRASAPQMRPQTELMAAAAAVAMNPAFLALDGLAALLKMAWRLAVAAAVGLALKPQIEDILKSRIVSKYTSQIKLNRQQLKIVLAIFFFPVASRYLRKAVGLVVAQVPYLQRFTQHAQNSGRMGRRGARGGSRPKRLDPNDINPGGGDGGGGNGGDGGGGAGGGGDGGGGDGGGGEGGGGDGGGLGGVGKSGRDVGGDEGKEDGGKSKKEWWEAKRGDSKRIY